MNLAMPRLGAWMRGSIGARIAALLLGLLLAIQIASFGAIRASLSQHALSALPARLEVGNRVLASLIERDTQTLVQGAGVLAADYGFRTAVLSGDADTIASALENQGARIGATEAALLATDFALRANSGEGFDLGPIAARLAPKAGAGKGPVSDLAVIRGLPHAVVLVPIKAPVLAGWVLMGFPLDRRLVADVHSLAALDLTVLTRADPDLAWRAVLTGEPADRAEALARAVDARGEIVAQRTHDAGLQEVRIGDDRLGIVVRRLAPSVVALLSVSIDRATALPSDLQAGLAAITLLGFVVSVAGSFWSTRRLTVPLRSLSAAAERLGAGDYATPIGGRRRSDEVGALAHAFERMRISVAEKQAEILKFAYWDGLTGLPNRARFREAVCEAIVAAQAASAAGRPASIAVVMLDLDRFKHVNDVLGYRYGDLLLQAVAARLSSDVVRGGDTVARLGGDEFAVLLASGDRALAHAVAARIGAAFDQPLQLEDHTIDMNAAVGIACWPEHAADADTLLGRAEVAMYTAKRRADGALEYDPSFDATSAKTLSLLSELRRAVEMGELRLFLQPKLDLECGRVRGAEALVRWHHPSRGLVPPMEFIPFAEQTGFIRVLTRWVFEEAVVHWLRLKDPTLKISINLSTRDLLDPELPQRFDAYLAKHLAPAEAFCLEITESAIMDDPQRSLATLERLSALGFKLSIDDFGTGYSSLAYLKRLPVDELKIDRSFVMNMVDDQDDAKIVRSTIDLAHNLGLTVVAEGVENARMWDALRELDCDEAQGYHMGRPMPADEFVAWSAKWSAGHSSRLGGPTAMLH